MQRYFTDAQQREITTVAKDIYKVNKFTQAYATLSRCSMNEWD